MKMTLDDIDQQIRAVENRIAAERVALSDAMTGCTNSVRESLTSPKTLLALLGVGFAVGKVVFREKPPPQQSSAPVKKAGVLGLLTGAAGTALSLAGPRYGWGGVARWAAGRYFAGRQSRAAAAARAAGAARAPISPAVAASPSVAPTAAPASVAPRTTGTSPGV